MRRSWASSSLIYVRILGGAGRIKTVAEIAASRVPCGFCECVDQWQFALGGKNQRSRFFNITDLLHGH